MFSRPDIIGLLVRVDARSAVGWPSAVRILKHVMI